MKIYLLIENGNIIRCAFMNDINAEKILDSFLHLDLKIKEIEIIDWESEKMLKELLK